MRRTFLEAPPAATDASKAIDIGANAATKTPNKVAPADVAFMQTLTIGNLAKIDLGKLATQRAGDPEVQEFERRMVVRIIQTPMTS